MATSWGEAINCTCGDFIDGANTEKEAKTGWVVGDMGRAAGRLRMDRGFMGRFTKARATGDVTVFLSMAWDILPEKSMVMI